LPLRSKKTWKEKYRKIAAPGQGERLPADDLAVHTVQGLKTTFRTYRPIDPASMFTGNRIFNTKALRTGVWALDRFATFMMVVDKSSRRKNGAAPT
jgi:hypothetical protein